MNNILSSIRARLAPVGDRVASTMEPVGKVLGMKPVKYPLRTLGVLFIYALPILHLPLINTEDSDFSGVLFTVGTYVLVALGLNIVIGYAGLLDLGYVGFYAVGAYTVGVITSEHGQWPFFLALPLALFVTMISGVLLGAPTLRVRGDYLAIVTMGFGEIIRIVARNTDWLGGAGGINSIPAPPDMGIEVIAIIVLILVIALTVWGVGLTRASARRRADKLSSGELTPSESTNMLAVVALVGSFVGALPGIVSGHIALSQLKRSGEKGWGLAVAAVWIGYASIATAVLAVLGVLTAASIASAGSATEESAKEGLFKIPHLSWEYGYPTISGRETTFLHFGVLDATPYFWMILTTIIIVICADMLIKNSRVGRAWEATREDEDVAELMGVPTFKFKLLAFAMGACIGGLAGAMYATRVGFINPPSFPLMLSMLFVAAVVIGGAGNRWGAILGAVIVAYLPERFREFADWRLFVFGIALIAIVSFRTQGLFPGRQKKRVAQAEKEVEKLEEGADVV